MDLPDRSDLDAFLAAVAREARTRELAVVIAHGEDVLEVAASHDSAESSSEAVAPFRVQLGCLSELLVAILTLQLAEAGMLDLEARIIEYLPELRASRGGNAAAIRVSHLLSHTGGYKGLSVPKQLGACNHWEQFASFFCSTRQLFTPGAVFNFERSEYGMLGEILLRVTGKKFIQLVNRQILSVACSGRRATFAATPAPPLWENCGVGLELSLTDLTDLARALGQLPGIASGSPAFSTFVRSLAMNPVVSIPLAPLNRWDEDLPNKFGLGCAGYADHSFGRSGRSYVDCCAIRFFPEEDVSISVGMRSVSPRLRDLVIRKMFSRMITDYESTAQANRIPDWVPSSVAGEYCGGMFDGRVTVTEVIGGVKCCFGKPENFLTIASGEGGKKQRHGPLSRMPVTFFLEPGSTSPCLGLGLHAFKRLGPVTPHR